MYMYAHVHTRSWIHINVCSMYIHVHEFLYLYVNDTYMVMNIYSCMYILQTLWRLYSDSFTTTLHFPSGPISLATLASLSSARQAPLLQSRLLPVMYHVHTLLIHGHTLYIHVHTLYTGTTLYHHNIWHQELVCTALVIGMYYAIVQESAILYIHVSERYIPLKTGFARVVAFL